MTLLVITSGTLVALNLLWMCFSGIYDLDDSEDYQYESLSYFDKTMIILEGTLAVTLYYFIIISGPIDICKMYMLKENKKIFGLLICFIGGIKLGFLGLIFDDLVNNLIVSQFIY